MLCILIILKEEIAAEEASSPYRLDLLMRRYRDEVTAHKKGCVTEARCIDRLLRDPISKQELSDLTCAVIATFGDRRMRDGIRYVQKPSSHQAKLVR